MAVINKVQLQKCFVSVFMCFRLCFPSILQDGVCQCPVYVQLIYVLSLSGDRSTEQQEVGIFSLMAADLQVYIEHAP